MLNDLRKPDNEYNLESMQFKPPQKKKKKAS